MRHPVTKRIHGYWRDIRGARLAPDRRELDPASLGRDLADVFVLESDDKGGYRFRIAGSRICGLFGCELRDRSFETLLAHDSFEDAHDMLAAVTEDLSPVIGGVSALLPARHSVNGELLLLPLTNVAGQGARVFGALGLGAPGRGAGLEPAAANYAGACVGLHILTFRIMTDHDAVQLRPEAPAALPASLIRPDAADRRSKFRVIDGGRGRA